MRRLLGLLVLLSAPAFSQTKISFTSVVVFGDSLSDTGQFYNTTLSTYGVGYPSPQFGYTTGRFTDGVDSVPAARTHFGVWEEQLNDMAPGIPLMTPALKGGTNYAFGSATTANGISNYTVTAGVTIPVRNMGQQVTDYLAANKPSSTALYILFGGANDYLQNSSANPVTVAGNVVALAQTLHAAGAVNIMVLNLPPTGSDTASVTWAATFGAALAAGLGSLQGSYPTGLNIYQPDILSLFSAITKAPATFGFTDVTSTANLLGSSINPDTYLLWDGLHPTTTGHYWIASAACSAMTHSSLQLTSSASGLTATLGTSGQTTIPVVATGSVSFYSDVFTNGVPMHTLIGSAPLNSNGVATLSSTQIPKGTYTISAVYSGDLNYAQGCRSASVAFTSTTAPSFTLSVPSTALSVTAGSSVTTTVGVTSVAGFAQAVTIICGSGLPQYFTCSVANGSIASGSSATATVTIGTSVTSASLGREPLARRGVGFVLAFLLSPLALLGMRKRRAVATRFLALLLVVGLGALSGCGGSGPSGTTTHTASPGTYNVTIIGTAADGTTTATTALAVTVK